MAHDLFRPERFKLPARIRTAPRVQPQLQLRLRFADLIADLDGISVIERDPDTVPCRVDVFLTHPPGAQPGTPETRWPLCSLGRDGLTVYGLDRWGRYQVVSRGWGVLDADSVRLELPRDEAELDVAWRVLRRAYDALRQPSDGRSGHPAISPWDWPRFSRTSLQ